MFAPVDTKRGTLGISMATALVVGNMIGSGVFLLPASLAAYGPISIVALALTGIGAMLLALVFAKLGRTYPETGGPYAYSRRAFGEFVGFQQASGLLDRSLGRQCSDCDRVRQLSRRVLAGVARQQPLSRGRGGPRCMSCPVMRESVT